MVTVIIRVSACVFVDILIRVTVAIRVAVCAFMGIPQNWIEGSIPTRDMVI
jgi:hypothetical protein